MAYPTNYTYRLANLTWNALANVYPTATQGPGFFYSLTPDVTDALAGNDAITGTATAPPPGNAGEPVLNYIVKAGVANYGRFNLGAGDDSITGRGVATPINFTSNGQTQTFPVYTSTYGIFNAGVISDLNGTSALTTGVATLSTSSSVFGLYNQQSIYLYDGNDVITVNSATASGNYGIYNGAGKTSTSPTLPAGINPQTLDLGDNNDTIRAFAQLVAIYNDTNYFINTGSGTDSILATANTTLTAGAGTSAGIYQLSGAFLNTGIGSDTITAAGFSGIYNNGNFDSSDDGDRINATGSFLSSGSPSGIYSGPASAFISGSGNDTITSSAFIGVYNQGNLLTYTSPTSAENDIINAGSNTGTSLSSYGLVNAANALLDMGAGADSINAVVRNDSIGVAAIINNGTLKLDIGNDTITATGRQGVSNTGTVDAGAGTDQLRLGTTLSVFGVINATPGLIDLGADNDTLQALASATDTIAIGFSNTGSLIAGAGADSISATGYLGVSNAKLLQTYAVGGAATLESDVISGGNTTSFIGLYNRSSGAQILTGAGTDTVLGTASNNVNAIGLYTDAGTTIDTGSENDSIRALGATGVDNSGTILTGTGNDTITAGDTISTYGMINRVGGVINMGDGNDILSASSRAATPTGYSIMNDGLIDMGAGADTINVTPGNNLNGFTYQFTNPSGARNGTYGILMGTGNDSIVGFGDAAIDGGAGTDTLRLPNATSYTFRKFTTPNSPTNYWTLSRSANNVTSTMYFNNIESVNGYTGLTTATMAANTVQYTLTISNGGVASISGPSAAPPVA